MRILRQRSIDEVANVYVAELRGDEKYLIEMVDGLDVKFSRKEKWIINISTQFGCPIGCKFCDAGTEYHGELTEDEMIGQIEFIINLHPEIVRNCKKPKVHFARLGEPSLNDEVLKVIPRLKELIKNDNLWCCIPTIVPKGREEWFEELLKLKKRYFPYNFQLQFSMNSTDQNERERIMTKNIQPFEWIAEYGKRFHNEGGRKPVLNSAYFGMMSFDVESIKKIFPAEYFAIKITPMNPTSRTVDNNLLFPLLIENDKRLACKIEKLRECGFDVIISIGDMRENIVGSNCGQSVRFLKREMER